ncbi:MAG: formylglycine-generating enzyme family protein [Saprospiraceae bacterium]|nr:formylglycine-generating enzyme family protein [Saprospiraceae bacterium]
MSQHAPVPIFKEIPYSTMTFVKGGTFQMGEGKDLHAVRLDDFWIGTFPVTQALWKKVMGNANPSWFKGDNRPVENVSWNDIKNTFLPALNKLTGKNYRLPTEAEWEYAAKGGEHWTNNFQYAGSNDIDEVAWFVKNSHQESKPVGLKAPNQLGLYDMSGNVWEWCSDWYGNYSPATDVPIANPTGAVEGSYRVMRGGSWFNSSVFCRTSYRYNDHPAYDYNNVGFRLVLPFQSVGGRSAAYL